LPRAEQTKARLWIGQPELAWAIEFDQGSGVGQSALVSARLQRYT
jgi:hypothetical protein